MSEIVSSLVEATRQPRLRAVGLSHLSIEVGHLYMDDLEAGPEMIQKKIAAVAPWAQQAMERYRSKPGSPRARISTCYLVDDYFSSSMSPATVIPMIQEAASLAGVRIDYLARESSCAADSGIKVAEMVAGKIVAEPHPSSNGSRPPTVVSGWLSNGKRSPNTAAAAMKIRRWQPPVESAANRHSIFIDVELWNEGPEGRIYSCPYLAAIWQLARLGMLRHHGEPVLQPTDWTRPWPSTWQAMPAVTRLNPDADPFSAYSTFSVIGMRFLLIEVAVRTILGQIAIEPEIVTQIAKRARSEGLQLADTLPERTGYVFAHEPWSTVT